MILFFDLDGPILDVAPRYVALHHELLREHGIAGMEETLYWAAKRARRSEEDILAELGAAAVLDAYVPRRLELIESAAYLRHDRCWPWALNCLTLLARHAPLVMVTARTDRLALVDQLHRLGLWPFFHEILSEPGGPRVALQKAALITAYLGRQQLGAAGSWMIGDTEADIQAGQHVGLGTVAVLTGIRDRDHLSRSRPDFIVPDIRDLPSLLDLPAAPAEKPLPETGSP